MEQGAALAVSSRLLIQTISSIQEDRFGISRELEFQLIAWNLCRDIPGRITFGCTTGSTFVSIRFPYNASRRRAMPCGWACRVVTLTGKTAAGRAGWSILANLGLSNLGGA